MALGHSSIFQDVDEYLLAVATNFEIVIYKLVVRNGVVRDLVP